MISGPAEALRDGPATAPRSSATRTTHKDAGASTNVPLIHNPVSGSARGGVLLRKVVALLNLKGVQVEPIPTRHAGHATELARELGAKHDRILVLGGDGTLSEAANGVLSLPAERRPTLGFIPGGTGNDFLRDFGIRTIEDAARAIGAGKTVAVDAVKVTWPGGERWSINLVASGLAAKAAERFGKSLRWMGKKGYDVAAAIEIATMKACPTDLTLDGSLVQADLPLVIACNSVHTGGAMPMAPDATPTDGVLDVVTVQDTSRLGILDLLATKVRKGKHVHHPNVKIRRAAHVIIAPRDQSPLNIDGEVIGHTPVELRVVPGAFRLLA